MHLKKLIVENFRSLEKIDVDFDSPVSVIIGPNAVGKTTILEAIRMAKAVLAPRTQNETNQTLISLGFTSPHMPQRSFPRALTSRSLSNPLSIKCKYAIETHELEKIKLMAPKMAATIAQQNAGLAFAAAHQVMAYLSSQQGSAAMQLASQQLQTEIARVSSEETLELNLTIDFSSGQMRGEFPVQQIFFATLDQALDPSKTLFSYFPADRAMPVGEQPVQLGMADTNNQLESYNSQPYLKFNRLKSTIFNSIIMGDQGREDLKSQFELIFNKILKGRKLGEIGVNEIGMLSIPIIDTDTGATFQIDTLSSGEKGLILTFLLIATNMEDYGLILLDEPELHLNPAVCRDLLQFFVDEYAIKKHIQGIICSHSAEILAGAFERQECSLFHLRDSRTLAKVRPQDHGEIRDALRRLGSSESEALLYKGTISVEGIHDIEILQAGFDDILRRYRIQQRGGRIEIQKDIKKLQDAEERGEEIGNHYFMFDLDRKPTTLNNTAHVRLFQLDRYCLENYLLDCDILTDLSRNNSFSDTPINNITEMQNILKTTAMSQLDEFVARSVFKDLGMENIAFDMSVMKQNKPELIAVDLHSQITTIMANIETICGTGFDDKFINIFNNKRMTLKSEWENKWLNLCNGKRVLENMRSAGHIKGDLLRIKKAVVQQMRVNRSPDYRLLESYLLELIAEQKAG